MSCTDHPRGRHKARVFATALGIAADNVELLRQALLDAARDGEARETEGNGHGRRYVLDFEMEGPAARARVRSCWIIRAGEDFPRLTSCYVL